ncbi:MAG: universal stress protein [Gemmatimonadaceae bacterium]|jgi:nucleotide-binding universal stress UspA family protein|nr:universal stress protein [Gemmatimonadaceae bacterium]
MPATQLPQAEPTRPITPSSGALAIAAPILVATDGLEPSDGAFYLASSLAAHRAAQVAVISVFEPVVAADIQFASIPALPAGWYAEQKEARLAQAREQLERTVGASTQWPIVQIDGETAAAVLVEAATRSAQLVLVGRGKHGLIERVLGGETVLRLLRGGDVPVLAVDPAHRGLFRKAVIATDFSPQSIHAARTAMKVLAPTATIVLVNVRPRPVMSGAAYDGWRHMYEQTLPAAFDTIRSAIQPLSTMRVETLSLEGDPARAVVEFAEATGADLVVSATHGYGFMHRLVVGSVATELLRSAPCSFLCVPGSALDHASTRAQLAARYLTETLDAEDWPAAMEKLTREEGTRPASLEVDGPAFGAQVVVSHVPFIGAAFERAGARVQLMFGAADARGYHITHAFQEVTAIDLLRDESDVPRVVRFVHADGQTLLTFES